MWASFPLESRLGKKCTSGLLFQRDLFLQLLEAWRKASALLDSSYFTFWVRMCIFKSYYTQAEVVGWSRTLGLECDQMLLCQEGRYDGFCFCWISGLLLCGCSNLSVLWGGPPWYLSLPWCPAQPTILLMKTAGKAAASSENQRLSHKCQGNAYCLQKSLPEEPGRRDHTVLLL